MWYEYAVVVLAVALIAFSLSQAARRHVQHDIPAWLPGQVRDELLRLARGAQYAAYPSEDCSTLELVTDNRLSIVFAFDVDGTPLIDGVTTPLGAVYDADRFIISEADDPLLWLYDKHRVDYESLTKVLDRERGK